MDSRPPATRAVTRGQIETKESDMKRYRHPLIATLAVLGLADAAKADWGFLAYGGLSAVVDTRSASASATAKS